MSNAPNPELNCEKAFCIPVDGDAVAALDWLEPVVDWLLEADVVEADDVAPDDQAA